MNNTKITIGIITSDLKIGGEEQVVYNWITTLDKNRYNPIVFCFYDPGVIGEELEKNRIRVVANIFRSKYDIAGIARLKNALKQEKIEAVYILNKTIVVFYFGIFLSYLWKNKIITASHSQHFYLDPFLSRPFIMKKLNIMLKRMFQNNIYKYIALTDRHKRFLLERESIPADKLTVIHNGIDIEMFEQNRDQATENSNHHLAVGIIAVLRPEKAHHLFLKSAKRILNEVPHVQFHIIGDGPERNNLETLARELKIADNVRFWGYRSDIPQVLKDLDVFVLTSKYEVFPMSILEAMAASKPVVATDVGSVSDIVMHGETGYLIQSGSVDQIVDKVIALLKNPDLRKNMGKYGHERVRRNFIITKMTQEYEKLFESMNRKK